MIALIILLGFYSCVSAEQYPRLKAYHGSMEGTYRKSNSTITYEAYEGIPYAEPPAGYYRFEPPIEKARWGSAILIAKKLGDACIQWDEITDKLRGSEDCLFLNIYRPSRPVNSKLPIIVYIHGPDFQTGSGGSGVKYLMDRSVIVVTFNYRLGPFGFLSTGDQITPGNMGLKDQVLALKWIQLNADSIGGKATEVTIIGHGAGGASVHYHYLSQQTKPLFRKGMSLSGTALAPWALAREPLQKTKKLAAAVGCTTSNNKRMIDCLKGTRFEDILSKSHYFKGWLKSPYAPWGPVVEKWVTDSTFITRSPLEYILSGKAKNLPWIVGVVSHEGTAVVASILGNREKLAQMNMNFELLAPYLFDYNYTVPEWKQSVIATSVQAALLQARSGKGPIRFMKFSYRGKHSYTEEESGTKTVYGIGHRDDIAYVFESFVDTSDHPDDHVMRKMMIDIWESYTTLQNNVQPKVSVEWPSIKKNDEEFDHLQIYRPIEMRIENSRGLGEREFWRSLGINEEILTKFEVKPKEPHAFFFYQNHIKPCSESETVYFFS